jgi:hypothetical protein
MNILKEIENKGYLKLLLMVGSVIIVLKFALFPLISNWRELNLTIENKESQLDRALRLIAFKEDLDRAYARLSSRVDVDEVFQPQEIQKLSFYKQINSLADKNRVRIRTLRPASGLEEGLYFDIEGEGSFISIVKFLSQLENPYTQNYIQELVLTPSSGKKILFRLKIKREYL